MKQEFILFLALWSLFACQSLGLFKEQFLLEINKFKPSLKDKSLEKMILKFVQLYTVEYSHTVKTVDLKNIMKTCNLDFEINLVQSDPLPASDHQINHINIGGLLIPGQTPNYKNFWAATIGVVIKNNGEFNSVYSLMYNLKVDFNKVTFMKTSGLDLTSVDERVLVSYIIYNQCLKIYNEELLPVKSAELKSSS